MRRPPTAGPSAVEWMAMTPRKPVAVSFTSWTFLNRYRRR